MLSFKRVKLLKKYNLFKIIVLKIIIISKVFMFLKLPYVINSNIHKKCILYILFKIFYNHEKSCILMKFKTLIVS